MPGGYGKIDEYNKSLTPEQKSEMARKAGSSPRKSKTIRDIARAINSAKISDKETRLQLAQLGLKNKDLINGAMIAASLFQSAMNGNMQAYDRWLALVDDVSAKANSNAAKDGKDNTSCVLLEVCQKQKKSFLKYLKGLFK